MTNADDIRKLMEAIEISEGNEIGRFYQKIQEIVWDASRKLSSFEANINDPEIKSDLDNAIKGLDQLRRGKLHTLRSGTIPAMEENLNESESNNHLKQFQPGENITTEEGKRLETYFKVSDSAYYDTKQKTLYRLDPLGASDKHTDTFLSPEEIKVLAGIVGKE